MNSLKKTCFAALFGALVVTAPMHAMAQVAIDKVVAVVAGDPITQKELDERIKINTAVAKRSGQKVTAQQLSDGSRDELITERLLLNKAKNARVNISDDQVNQSLQNMAQNNGMTLDAFKARVDKEGGAGAWEGLQHDVRNDMTVNKLLDQEVISKVPQLTDKEVDAEVQRVSAIPDGPFASQDVAVAAHIFVAGTTPASLKKIKAIKARIDKGEDFATVAKAESQNPETAANGGLVPYIAVNDKGLEPAIAKVAKDTPLNTVTEPVKTANGYNIFKFYERKTLTPTDDQKKQMAKQALMSNRQKEALDAWYKDLDASRATLVEIKK